jgi:hypothetical protein
MYASKNVTSKKALKDAITKGEKITVFNPGLGGAPPKDGSVTLEGPHSPKPHKWYGEAVLKDGYIVSVK